MGCPPAHVRGDNPRALGSGSSYVSRWTNMVQLFYTTYISVNLAHHEIFRARVGKDGIKLSNRWQRYRYAVEIQIQRLTACLTRNIFKKRYSVAFQCGICFYMHYCLLHRVNRIDTFTMQTDLTVLLLQGF